jgi:hypothetical protein
MTFTIFIIWEFILNLTIPECTTIPFNSSYISFVLLDNKLLQINQLLENPCINSKFSMAEVHQDIVLVLC